MIKRLWIIALLLTVLPCWGRDAFDQNKRLGRGVNIIGYDPIWNSLEQGRFKARHFQLLKEAGFQSVRVNLHPFRHMKDGRLGESWWRTLDWVLKEATDRGLAVILDCHEYHAMGNDPEGNKERFLSFWHQLAEHSKNAPDTVFFEILNEPNKNLTPSLWNVYLREALAIIREKNPTRTVIVGPAFWNSVDHLDELELPETDTNLIVTVHYYKPMTFTHQGAAWAGQKDKTGIEWLGTDAEQAAIAKDFDKVAAWAKTHHRPVFLGEFGAYDKAPMESRARYTDAVARAAEARGWSWAYWQFDSDFVLYDIQRDAWVEPIRQALVPKTLRVLLTIGGHGFQQKEFFAFWDALPGVSYKKCELPKQADLLKPGLEKEYDVIVLYDMVKKFTPEQQKAFVALLQTGIGLVATHHSLGAHDDWPEYTKIIGGKYVHKPTTLDGREHGPSSYAHDQELRVTIADKQHPITRGLADFTIHDEAYGNFYVAPGVHVLLTTDHPQCGHDIAWTTQYGNSRVCYLIFGHDNRAWQNPHYKELLLRAIRWSAAR